MRLLIAWDRWASRWLWGCGPYACLPRIWGILFSSGLANHIGCIGDPSAAARLLDTRSPSDLHQRHRSAHRSSTLTVEGRGLLAPSDCRC